MRALTCFVLLAAAAAAGAESLYEEGSFQGLTADRRAYRLGDILTVLVLENSSASASADTTTEKRGSVAGSITAPNRDQRAALELAEDFTGKGRIQRSGRLLATVSATVQLVQPNGDLVIAGAQQIEVNGEKQNIRITGRVRPIDVSESNTVPSSRIADAQITYVGEGLLGEKQRPGILTRFLSWLHIL